MSKVITIKTFSKHVFSVLSYPVCKVYCLVNMKLGRQPHMQSVAKD